jgi:hypothetical protein
LSHLANVNRSSCIFSSFKSSSSHLVHSLHPHPLYTCSPTSLRLDVLSNYIASRTSKSSDFRFSSRIIKAHHPPSAFPLFPDFQFLTPSAEHASPSKTSNPPLPDASSAIHHIVVVGDSIDAFFHFRNRRVSTTFILIILSSDFCALQGSVTRRITAFVSGHLRERRCQRQDCELQHLERRGV